MKAACLGKKEPPHATPFMACGGGGRIGKGLVMQGPL